MKKLLPYILILLVVVSFGFLSPNVKKVQAEDSPSDTGICTRTIGSGEQAITKSDTMTREECGKISRSSFVANVSTPPNNTDPNNQPNNPKPKTDEDLEKTCISFTRFSLDMCVFQFLTIILIPIPSLLITITAHFLNMMLIFGLTSSMISGFDFISKAWTVVRDISNIFFILILLYTSIQIILGLGHETKKIIVKVIIAALLINFSMFFTNVVIDSSNMIALVFYNKLDVTSKAKYEPVTSIRGERDIGGALANAFNPNKLISKELYEGTLNSGSNIASSIGMKLTVGLWTKIALVILAGSMMLLASYCYFIAGLSFFYRLLELWILIIISPFAFMSFSFPSLKSVEYVGWDSWIKRLLKTAFMAPIFLFFMYFIFMLLKALQDSTFAATFTLTGIIQLLMSIMIPLAIVQVLLLKAAKMAEKMGGEMGEKIIGYGKTAAKAVGTIAVAAATDGASLALTSTVGAGAAKMASDPNLRASAASGNKLSQAKLWAANKMKGASFDMSGAVSEVTGLKLKSSVFKRDRSDGYTGDVKRGEKKLKEKLTMMKWDKDTSPAEIAEYSKKRQARYDSDMATSIKSGNSKNAEDYIKKNGERPADLKNVKQANKEITDAFIKSLPQNSFVGSMAFKNLSKKNAAEGGFLKNEVELITSQEHTNWDTKRIAAAKTQGVGENDKAFNDRFKTTNPEPTIKSVNDSRLSKTKMKMGVGIGAVVPGASMGALAGGADEAAAAKFMKGIVKEEKTMGKVADRIEEMKDILESQKEILKDGIKEGFIEVTGKDSTGEDKHKINIQKITDAIAEAEAEAIAKRSEFDAISKRVTEPNINSALERDFRSQMGKLQGDMVAATKKINSYNAMKGIGVSIAKTNNELFKLEEKQSEKAKTFEPRVEHNTKEKTEITPAGGGAHPPAGGGAHPPAGGTPGH